MDTNQQPVQDESIFSEELHNIVQYEQATQGQRALNWIIDNILMNWGLSYVTGTAVGYLLGSLFPEFILGLTENSTEILLIGYIIALFNYLIYYTICEKAFKGYTLGKLITGCRAIRADGGELTIKDAFLRSASRLVPFEVFSGFGQSPGMIPGPKPLLSEAADLICPHLMKPLTRLFSTKSLYLFEGL